jgi:hypothetical protein
VVESAVLAGCVLLVIWCINGADATKHQAQESGQFQLLCVRERADGQSFVLIELGEDLSDETLTGFGQTD